MLVTYYATAWAILTAVVAFWVTGWHERLGLRGLVSWAVVVVGGTALAVLVGRGLLDLDRFGAMNVVFRQLVIGLPLAAVLIAIRSLRRGWGASTTGLASIAIVLALLWAPLGYYMANVEPNKLVVHETSMIVPAMAAGQTLRLGILSDLQTTAPGALEQRAVDAVMAGEPDVILIPGDIFQASAGAFERELSALRALLGQLQAPGGVFLVPGDVDTPERLTAVTRGTGIRMLTNQITTTTVDEVKVRIAGLGLDYRAPEALAAVRRLELARGAGEVRILLAHHPDAIGLLPATGARTDLVVAGHTHGGQVVLPLVGPLMTHSSLPRRVTAGGLHQLGQRSIYVSSGVGVERGQAPRMRLLDPPSVSILTLQGS